MRCCRLRRYFYHSGAEDRLFHILLLFDMADSKLALHDGMVRGPEEQNVDLVDRLLFFEHLSYQSRFFEDSERLFSADDVDVDFRWRQSRAM